MLVDKPDPVIFRTFNELARSFEGLLLYHGMGTMIGVNYPANRGILWFAYLPRYGGFTHVFTTPTPGRGATILKYT